MSVGTGMYREQHDHLRVLATELTAALDGAAPLDAAGARAVLARLAGRLAVHLAMEDRSLYPFLLGQPEERLRVAARRFREEMGGLHDRFGAHCARWPSAAAVSSDPAGFAAETRAILAALEDRMRREDEELFPLAERSGP